MYLSLKIKDGTATVSSGCEGEVATVVVILKSYNLSSSPWYLLYILWEVFAIYNDKEDGCDNKRGILYFFIVVVVVVLL